MSDPPLNFRRRRFLVAATGTLSGVATIAVAVPFTESLLPSERARAAGAPVEVDFSKLAPGEIMVSEWRRKPIWILRRTSGMLKDIQATDALVSDPRSDASRQPDFARNEYRSLKPKIFVVIGICTHLGCSPKLKPAADEAEMGPGWTGGFYCPCHGSKFDLAGRVLKGSPAPTNLVVPPYAFVGDDRIIIGSAEHKA
jgi:ubiquinol-cytochrome c reductase iron-sulfur subunit